MTDSLDSLIVPPLGTCLQVLVTLQLNDSDRAFGQSLATQGESRWSAKQRWAAYKLVTKYTKQLAGAGIDTAALVPPANPVGVRLARLLDEDTAVLTYAYQSEDPTVAGAVEQIPGVLRSRQSTHGKLVWYAGLSLHTVDALVAALHDSEFDVDHALPTRCLDLIESSGALDASRALTAELDVPGLGIPLLPFQKAGVLYALDKRRVLIGDEMGLGKTPMALATCQVANLFPALFVVPAFLRYNWLRESIKWLPGRSVGVFTRDGKPGTKRLVVNGQVHQIPINNPSVEIGIASYESVGEAVRAIGKRGQPLQRKVGRLFPHIAAFTDRAKVIGADESHYLMNPRAQRSLAVQAAAQGKTWRLAMSGTPVLSRPSNLIGQLAYLGRLEEFGGEEEFARRYCARRERVFNGRRVIDVSGATHLTELNTLLRRNFLVRRTKQQVLPDLQKPFVTMLAVKLDNRAEYEKAEADIVSWLVEQVERDPKFLDEIAELPEDVQQQAIEDRKAEVEAKASRAQAILKLEHLGQLAAKGKLAAVREWLVTFLDDQPEAKMLLFATHREIVKTLAQPYHADTIMGGIADSVRDEAVRKFQEEDHPRVMVLNHKAGGAGLTLTRAWYVLLYELPWNPADVDQDIARAWGRLNDPHPVNVYYFLGENTIDEDKADLLEQKRTIVDAVTDGAAWSKGAGSIAGELIRRLLARVKERNDA